MPETEQIEDAGGPVEPGTPAASDDAGEPPPDDEINVEVLEGLAEADEQVAHLPGPSRLGLAKVFDAIDALNDRLGRRFDALQNTFERELRAEASRERVVDRLHAELQEYKQDFLLKVQRPIFIDLIQLHDDIGKMAGARGPAGDQSDQQTHIRGVLESIQVAIEDILYRQGVEPFAIDGPDFDPRRQRAVSTETTDDATLNKKVASRLRKGFCSGDRLIRPEVVTVYTFRPPA